MSVKKTHAMFVSEMAVKAPNVEVISEYSGARDPITVRCRTCGYVWDLMATNALRIRLCPVCARINSGEKRRLSRDAFLHKLEIVNPDIEIIGEYEKASTKVLVRCKRCGYEWPAFPSKLLRGAGCTKCTTHSGTSFVEQIIYLSLKSITGDEVLSRDRSIIDRELDIYIPSRHFAVEYGAWIWHKGKEEVDNNKINQCAEQGIRLIEIFDSYHGERKSTKNIWFYKKNLSLVKNIEIVKEIIIKLCAELSIPYSLSDKEFDQIQYEARINSRRITTEILNEKLKQNQANVLVVSEYQEMLTKVSARCMVCGHEWNITPANLLRGRGCPKCSKKHAALLMRRSHELFVAEVNECNPNIEVIGTYTGRASPILVRCKKHDHTWSCNPDSILKGAGCYKCALEKISKKKRKTHEEFVADISRINPRIEIIGHYENSSTKIEVHCRACANEWKAWPDVLMRGGGCPKCSHRLQTEKSRKTNEEFNSELKKVNPDIIPIDNYINASTAIRFQCAICSYIWKTTPDAVLKGHGCGNCKGNRRKTQDEFVEEMKIKHPTIEVIGTYNGSKIKVAFKCKVCGFEWEDRPGNLLSLGRGCRQCRKQLKRK